MADVCKYYLQGRCKFGNACRFNHSHPGHLPEGARRGGGQWNTYRSQERGGRNTYRSQGQNSRHQPDPYVDTGRNWDRKAYYQARPSYFDRRDQGGGGGGGIGGGRWDNQVLPSAAELMNIVKEDMKDWHQSSMWLLSCYTPHKYISCIPGFEDYSPEEVRWAAYQANNTGVASTHQQALGQLYQQFQDMWQKCTYISIQDASKLRQAQNTSRSLFPSSQQEKESMFSTPRESLFGDLTLPSPQLVADKPAEQLFSPLGVPSTPLSPRNQGFFSHPSQALFQSPQDTLFTPKNSKSHQQPPQQQQQQHSGEGESDALGLTEKEITAFRAEKFTLGAIPEHAPPPALCHIAISR